VVADLPSREELLANQLGVADLAVRAAASTPVKGWNAGQVCAHLVMNNGLFIEAARCVASGGPHVYDNESAVDDVATAALAAGAGSTGILADWLRQSVTAFVDLLTTLPDEVLEANDTTTIRSNGDFVVDAEQRRLGDLMVGQLTFHSGMLLQQVRDLLDA
jgi:hypothetical protein